MRNNNIFIQDNFFDKDFFTKLQREVVLQDFTSRYLHIKKTRPNTSSDNPYQRFYHNVPLSSKSKVVLEVKKNIKKYFKTTVKLHEGMSFYFLSFPNTPPNPHYDPGLFNCLIYLVGDNLVNNGTGFYEKVNDDLVLHTHIGFKENRAIFFDSHIYHSALQFAGNSSPRYVMANFIV
tara:strand:- start:796 stop:1326 length:531 start_codon:yes stop_codon:yes gene_type:complete